MLFTLVTTCMTPAQAHLIRRRVGGRRARRLAVDVRPQWHGAQVCILPCSPHSLWSLPRPHRTLIVHCPSRCIRAAPDGAGGFQSPPVDAGFVGGGRTLGQHFDAAGNLIFCHAAAVRAHSFVVALDVLCVLAYEAEREARPWRLGDWQHAIVPCAVYGPGVTARSERASSRGHASLHIALDVRAGPHDDRGRHRPRHSTRQPGQPVVAPGRRLAYQVCHSAPVPGLLLSTLAVSGLRSTHGRPQEQYNSVAHRVAMRTPCRRLLCLRNSYANDLHIGPDGVVYFSDSTVIAPRPNKDGYYDTLEAYMLTQLQVRWLGSGIFSACMRQVMKAH